MSRIQGVLKGKATDEPLSRLSTPKFTKTSLSFKCTFSLLGGGIKREIKRRDVPVVASAK